MPAIPLYIPLLFGACVLVTLFAVWQAAHRSLPFGLLIATLVAIQIMIPPILPLLAAPPMILILITLAAKKGRRFIDSLDLPTLTLLHSVRIAVEIVWFNWPATTLFQRS